MILAFYVFLFFHSNYQRKGNNLLDYFLYAAKNVAKEDEVKFFAFLNNVKPPHEVKLIFKT